MIFRRKTKRLSGLPIIFYIIILVFFVTLFIFSLRSTESIVEAKNENTEYAEMTYKEPNKDSIIKSEIYVPDVEVLPFEISSVVDSSKISKEKELQIDKKKEKGNLKNDDNKKVVKLPKEQNTLSKKDEVVDAKLKVSNNEKITKIGKDRKLTAFVPGTMGKGGKLPSHNCKSKGQLVMFITIDKAGNVINAGRSSGIKDRCNITAAVIWVKKYVKAKKSQNISQGTYNIVF